METEMIIYHVLNAQGDTGDNVAMMLLHIEKRGLYGNEAGYFNITISKRQPFSSEFQESRCENV